MSTPALQAGSAGALSTPELSEATRAVVVNGQDSMLMSGDFEEGARAGMLDALPALLSRGWRIVAALPLDHGKWLFLLKRPPETPKEAPKAPAPAVHTPPSHGM